MFDTFLLTLLKIFLIFGEVLIVIRNFVSVRKLLDEPEEKNLKSIKCP